MYFLPLAQTYPKPKPNLAHKNPRRFYARSTIVAFRSLGIEGSVNAATGLFELKAAVPCFPSPRAALVPRVSLVRSVEDREKLPTESPPKSQPGICGGSPGQHILPASPPCPFFAFRVLSPPCVAEISPCRLYGAITARHNWAGAKNYWREAPKLSQQCRFWGFHLIFFRLKNSNSAEFCFSAMFWVLFGSSSAASRTHPLHPPHLRAFFSGMDPQGSLKKKPSI